MSDRDFHAEALRILAGETAMLPQIEHLRAVASRWIPVDEKLPDDDQVVMIAVRDDAEPVWIGWHDDEGWRSCDASPLGTVTHWMPMIEGPTK